AAAAAQFKKALVQERLSALDEPLRVAIEKARDKPKDKRSGEEKALLEKHGALLTVKDEELRKRFEEFQRLEKDLKASVEERRKTLPASPPLYSILTD